MPIFKPASSDELARRGLQISEKPETAPEPIATEEPEVVEDDAESDADEE